MVDKEIVLYRKAAKYLGLKINPKLKLRLYASESQNGGRSHKEEPSHHYPSYLATYTRNIEIINLQVL